MKKGFTLIELLAVIVILALIALIATPIILGIINDSRENGKKRSAEGVEIGVKYAYLTSSQKVETPNLKDIDDNLNIDNIKSHVLDSDANTLTITTNDNIVCVISMDDNINLLCKNGNKEILNKEINYVKNEVKKICFAVTEENKTKGNIPKGNFEFGDEYICNVTDTEQYHFYVIEYGKTTNLELYSDEIGKANGTTGINTSNVALIMDQNIDSERIKWCLSGEDNACLGDGAKEKLPTNWNNVTVSLPTYYQINNIVANSNILYLIPEKNLPYWTITREGSSSVYRVYNNLPSSSPISMPSGYGTLDTAGVRPVITLSEEYFAN